MRTITTTVYLFDELNDSAKQKAIENIREQYYRYNDYCFSDESIPGDIYANELEFTEDGKLC